MTATDIRVRAENIRTLYVQVGNSFAAAAVVTIYMAATTWEFTPVATVAAWVAVQLASQLARVVVVRAYRRAEPDDAALPAWGRAYAAYMFGAGIIWGSTAWLFIHPAEPITVALTLCGLYGIAGGSVPVNAYNPPGLYAFVGAIFALLLVRLLGFGTFGYAALALASLAFAGIMAAFCRVQHRALDASFRIRFENAALVEALRVQTAAAEAAREQAEAANLAKSQFLAAASHDLRQPLHALGLFSGSLGTLALDNHARDLADQISNSVAAMERLFNTLLDISRLDAGVVAVRREAFSVDALFGRIVGSFGALAAQRGLRLQGAGGGHWVDSDAGLVEQIIGNLVANALAYTPRGSVMLTARRRGGAVVLECRDSGIGIAPADQARVFDEFVQLGNAERDRTKGLGLGLAIAQRTARLLGTRVELRSAPGRGSCLGLSLPWAPAGTVPVTAGSGDGDLVAGQRLLLVDDDAAVRSACAALFASWGVAAVIVAGADDAVAAFGSQPGFDTLICDYRLAGDADGLSVIALLCALQTPPPAACLVTGDVDPVLIARAAAAGVPLLHKPLLPGALRATLNHLGATGRRGAPAGAAAAHST
ncbi:MAG: hybrid sensor histidine kinase/response regulator [Sandarakinorhabdus sp.]|nr:hybrid sensor histidine kinase/response regulator [Sandarakinorhabdus sp.]